MEEDISVQDIADAIEDYVNGESPKRTIDELIKLRFSGDQEFINSAIHNLNHFLTDEDIRLDDPEYDTEMKSKLVTYVERIRMLDG